MLRIAVVGTLLTLGFVVGCATTESGRENGTAPQAHTTDRAQNETPTLPPPAGRRLPPNSVEALRALYDPVLAQLGVRLSRAALIDTSGGRYTKSDEGTHLALYVAPLDPDPTLWTAGRYIEGMWSITALLTPDVFGRWSGLNSYDICQEGLEAPAPGAEPPTETQVNIERPAAERLDWGHGSLVDVLRVSINDPAIRVVVSKELRASPEFQSVWQQAIEQANTSSTT